MSHGSKVSVMLECSICLSELSGRATYRLPCTHIFHLACITKSYKHGNRLCPLCRSSLPPSLAIATLTLSLSPSSYSVSERDSPDLPHSHSTSDHSRRLDDYGDDENPIIFDLQTSPPSSPPPSTAMPETFPESLPTVTIETFTEFPAVAATASPSNFAVLVKVRAPPATPGDRSRAPVDLVLVLDVSGSMEGCKLTLLKRAAGFVIDTLTASDRISIVTFSTAAHCVRELCYMSDDGRDIAHHAIDMLMADGETNIRAGIETAVRVLDDRGAQRNPVAGVLLLSDGQDNLNIGGHSGTFRQGQQEYYNCLLPSNTTVPIHTFGLGMDHDPRAMHAISNTSGGTFSFIEAEHGIQDGFATCIGGLLSVTTQHLEIILNAASAGVGIASVSSGSHPYTIHDSGGTAIINAGDLYADEEKNFLLHLSIPVSRTDQWLTLLTTECNYVDPLTGEAINVNGEPAVVRRPNELLRVDRRVNLVLDGQRNRIMSAENMRTAYVAAERGDLDGAEEVLESQRSTLRQTPSWFARDGICAWLDGELQEMQMRMVNSDLYERSGRAYSLSGLSSHLRQRAVAGAVGNLTAVANTANGWRQMEASGNVGYQTPSIREMVSRSHNYANQSSLPGGSELGWSPGSRARYGSARIFGARSRTRRVGPERVRTFIGFQAGLAQSDN